MDWIKSRLWNASTMLMLFTIPQLIFAQPDTLWTRTYGGNGNEQAYCVQVTPDGGYIIVGSTDSYGVNGDVYLVKTDLLGDTLWTHTYGGSGGDLGSSVQNTPDGGYIITGQTTSYSVDNEVYLIKIDSLGNTIWTHTYGGSDSDWGWSVQNTSDGGYIIAGATYSYGAGGSDVYLIKTDSLGNTTWTRTYGGSHYDGAWSVQNTPDYGYIIAGSTISYGAGNSDVYIIKTDSFGDTLWTRTYGGTGGEEGYCVQTTPDGGYIITGYTGSYGAGNDDVYLIKIDSLGDTMWTQTYGGSGEDWGHSVQNTPDRGYIIAGRIYSAGEGDVYLIKTDSFGNTIWTSTYDLSNFDCGHSVQNTVDGGYIIAGWTYSQGGGLVCDFYLIKLGPDVGIVLPPDNLTIQIINNEVHLTWDPVQGVTFYKVFSSDNPETGFEDISGTINGITWTCPVIDDKKFFYVKAYR